MNQRSFSLGRAAAALLSIHLITACNASSGASQATPNQPTSPVKAISSLPETGNSGSETVAWSTKENISSQRKIEVGDHPNIQMERFEIGNRPQRVRFMIADEINAVAYLSKSPQDIHFQGDSVIAKSENDKWSPFAMVVDTPVNLGLGKFADDSKFNGLAVSPQILLCGASALANLKEAGVTRSRIFQNWQIDVVNIFVKPVQHASEAESKMAIDAKGRVLNFQLSVWTRSGDCFLPSVSEVGEALEIADQRVHD